MTHVTKYAIIHVTIVTRRAQKWPSSNSTIKKPIPPTSTNPAVTGILKRSNQDQNGGKLDPVTGEIVPTGKRGRKPAPKPPEEQASPQAADNQYNLAEHKLVKQEVYIQELTQRISELEQQNTLLKSAMKKAAITLERTSNMLADISNK